MSFTFNLPGTISIFSGVGSGGTSGTSDVPQNMNAPAPPKTQIWGVYTLAGNKVFKVDSCVSVNFKDASKVSDFPVEQGAFATYNKVIEAFKPKVKLAVGGQVKIAAFIAALYNELRTVNLYNVYTPEMIYDSVTLEDYDYERTEDKGKNLLVATLTFRQVIQVQPQYATVTLPAAKCKNSKSGDKVIGGKVQAQGPPAPPPLSWSNVAARAEND